MSRARTILFFPLVLLLTLSTVISGCSAGDSSEGGHNHPMAGLAAMPADVQTAPVAVQQAYQFAVANPDVVTQIPCYCGCGAIGHTSNYACYVSGVDASGAITYDTHALGCSICVDISLDAMRLVDEGKSVPEIRTYVDTVYARYGPSNMPPVGSGG